MPRNYSGVFDAISCTTPPKSIIGIEEATGTNVQCEIYDIMIGSRVVPAAHAQTYLIGRTTADGATGSTPTPAPLNPDFPVSLSTLRTGAGTEPTYGTSVWEMSVNQQSTYRWVCQPGVGVGLYAAHAAATDGISLKCTANDGTAFAVDGYIAWAE
jgi:hypothetical protein